MFPVVTYKKRVPSYARAYNDGYCYHNNYSAYSPKVNVIENDDEYVVEVFAPGVAKENFKVSVENDVLNVSAEPKNDEKKTDEGYVRREFAYNAFKKSFGLPESADQDKVSAKYENGVLSVSIPKKEEAKPKPSVEIKVS